jgi:hypothetical protein
MSPDAFNRLSVILDEFKLSRSLSGSPVCSRRLALKYSKHPIDSAAKDLSAQIRGLKPDKAQLFEP